MNTGNITLRCFEPRDGEAILDLLMDGQVKKTYMIPDFLDRAAARPLFERLAQLSRQEDRFVRAICLEDRAIGLVNDVETVGGEVELGYALLPSCWGKGYATRALKLAIEALFARGFDTVRAAAFEINPASARVMEKAGMVRSMRQEQVEYRGQVHSCICYEICRNKGERPMRAFPEMKKKLAFGMMRLPMIGETVDYEQVCRMVDDFMARGFNYFDTATPYIGGQSEMAVKKCVASRYPRESFLLTDKLSPNLWEKAEDIRPVVQRQLDNCGVEYFDFYLMHAMNADRHQYYMDNRAYDIAQELKAEGKLRHVGISFHDSAAVLDRILTDRPEIEVVQIQFNYADMEDHRVQSRACYEVCRKHGKPVLIMEPVKGGSLANLPAEAAALLTGGSPASYAVRFAAGFEGVEMVLSGMSNTEQMLDNLSYMENFQPLTQAEHQLLEQVKPIFQGATRIPCTACRYCEEKCPAGIPIATMFAQINQLHKKEGTPKEDYAALAVHGDECVKCELCVSACPQHLQVCQLVAKAHQRLTEK